MSSSRESVISIVNLKRHFKVRIEGDTFSERINSFFHPSYKMCIRDRSMGYDKSFLIFATMCLVVGLLQMLLSRKDKLSGNVIHDKESSASCLLYTSRCV